MRIFINFIEDILMIIMSEIKVNNLAPIAMLISALLIIEYNMFFTFGAAINITIDLGEEIDFGTAILFFTGLLSSISMGVAAILIAINSMSSEDKKSFTKISILLVILAFVLFVFQLFAGFLTFMDIV